VSGSERAREAAGDRRLSAALDDAPAFRAGHDGDHQLIGIRSRLTVGTDHPVVASPDLRSTWHWYHVHRRTV
jgi:hypothetical protein